MIDLSKLDKDDKITNRLLFDHLPISSLITISNHYTEHIKDIEGKLKLLSVGNVHNRQQIYKYTCALKIANDSKTEIEKIISFRIY